MPPKTAGVAVYLISTKIAQQHRFPTIRGGGNFIISQRRPALVRVYMQLRLGGRIVSVVPRAVIVVRSFEWRDLEATNLIRYFL